MGDSGRRCAKRTSSQSATSAEPTASTIPKAPPPMGLIWAEPGARRSGPLVGQREPKGQVDEMPRITPRSVNLACVSALTATNWESTILPKPGGEGEQAKPDYRRQGPDAP